MDVDGSGPGLFKGNIVAYGDVEPASSIIRVEERKIMLATNSLKKLATHPHPHSSITQNRINIHN
jgi:hypothetical protein